MKHGYYLPKKDAELVTWSNHFASNVEQNAYTWEIPNDEVAALKQAAADFETLHKQADSPDRTKTIVAAKNVARAALAGKIQGMVDFRLKNPVITDPELVELGLHPRDKTPTRIPAPTTHPKGYLHALDVRRVLVDFQDQNSSESKAKPYGVNGAVIIYAVRDTPPVNHADLTRSTLATRTPHTLEFAEEERGKTLYIALCWQNERGEKGPWGEIMSAIIP
jgi:hypothetical protein